jgi:hypothetical protein
MSQHVYHVETSDGQTYTVTTTEHHDDHDENVFLRHLAQVISRTASQVAAGMILRYIYRGRK